MIDTNPGVHFGKPYIEETRITVQNVLELVDAGISFQDIIDNYYPNLKVVEIQECIEYVQ